MHVTCYINKNQTNKRHWNTKMKKWVASFGQEMHREIIIDIKLKKANNMMPWQETIDHSAVNDKRVKEFLIFEMNKNPLA